MSRIYTLSERTDKKYTVGQAVSSARRLLKDSGICVCVTPISDRSMSEKITLEELNSIAMAIYDESVYWGL